MRRCLISVVVLSTMAAQASGAEPDGTNWPQFRGPNGSGVAALGTYPAAFGLEKNLIWKTVLPPGVSSPCVWGQRIFLTGYDSNEKQLETICIQCSDGKVQWRRVAPAEKIERVHAISSPANATPATDGQRVYVYFTSFGLLCYDLEGNELWRRPLPLIRTRFGSGTSPIVSGTNVLLGRRGLMALDGPTGDVIWEAEGGRGTQYATPTIWQHGKGLQVVVLAPGRLTGYDASNGKRIWWLGGLPPQTCATPVLGDGEVFISVTGAFGEPGNFVGFPVFERALEDHDKNGDGALQVAEVPEDMVIIDRRASSNAGNSAISLFLGGFDQNGDKIISPPEWEQFTGRLASFLEQKPALVAVRLGGEGNIRKSHIDWQQSRGVAEVPSPLLHEGHIYTVRNGGIVHCRNADTGKELFRGRLGAIGGYFASPVAAKNRIYFASDRGTVVVISTGKKLEVLARNDLGEPIMATPALVDSTIYVRTETHLYAFAE